MSANWNPCPKCGSLKIMVLFQPEGSQHFARAVCYHSDCSCWWWLSKPDSEKVKRPAAHRKLVKQAGVSHCEMCLIPECDLPAGEVLEGHHIERYDAGGQPTKDNTLVLCTGCHKLWHWRQTWSRNRKSEGDSA